MKTKRQVAPVTSTTLIAAIYAAAIAFASVLLTGCAEKSAPKPAEAPRVKSVEALAMNANQLRSYSGEIKPRFETTLSFRVGGKVSARFVNLGDSVSAASSIAQLDKADLKLAENQARAASEQSGAQAKLAADDLVRHRDLFARDLISRAELESREATAASTAAQLRALQAAAEQTANATRYGDLAAGSAGVVTAVMVEAGQVVAAGQPIAQVAQTRQIEAAFAVPESQIRFLSTGQPVTVRLLDGDVRRTGRIREIAGMADSVSRTYAVRVQLDESDGDTGGFRLGMSTIVDVDDRTAAVATVDSASHSLVPLAAVVGDGKGTFVLVIDQGKTVKRAVEMQQVVQGDLVGVSGVRPGESIVAAGAQLIVPGTSVSAMQTKRTPS